MTTMDDTYRHPVFFELSVALDLPEHQRQVRKYFQIRRKSGGGDCSAPRSVSGRTYCIAFECARDQQAVLAKSQHWFEIGGETVIVVVRDKPEAPSSAESLEASTTTDSADLTAPAQDRGASEAEECSQVGDGESQSCVHHSQTFDLNAHLRLLWRKNELVLRQDFPNVQVKVGDAGHLAVEGSPEEISQWREKLLQEENSVSERLVSGLSPHLLSFLRKAFAIPGQLEDLLEVGDKAEIEVGDAELCIFSFGADCLDQVEKSLHREFKEVYRDLPKCSAPIQSALLSKMSQVNRGQLRVQVLFDPDGTVCLLGRTDEVDMLSESMCSYVLVVEGLSESSMVKASYCLSGGVQLLLCEGDITQLRADALVNAANESLVHSGGVAAALSKAGGPRVQKESNDLVKKMGKLPMGTVVQTTGGKLHCKALLHAVGPMGGMSGGQERAILGKVVSRVLGEAETMGLQTVAMPCISSGEAGFPADVCCEAIVGAVKAFCDGGRRSLRGVNLIDNRAEVVKTIRKTCDGILGGPPAQEEAGRMRKEGGRKEEDTARELGNGISVDIVWGAIESQQVDAFVCPMEGHRPFSTKIGSNLYEMLGAEITARFKEAAKEETWPGAAVLLENLPPPLSKAVFFANLPSWNGDEHGTSVEVLRHAFWNILSLCKNNGFGSVAFPMLGAGLALRFPPRVVARALLQEVHAFDEDVDSPLLVRVVILPDDQESWEALQTEMQNKDFTKEAQQSDKASAPTRIVLLGKTGTGKSNLANTIFGEELFTINHTANSGTHTCQAETKSVAGRDITLVDTPGFFDTFRPNEEMKNEILRCITECAPGPHAFLIVLKVEKYTMQEDAVITNICKCFSKEVFKYALIVFTHGDQLNKNQTIRDFIAGNKCLTDFAKMCGDRCYVIDNRHWGGAEGESYRSNRVQLEQLLGAVDQMIRQNGGRHYSNEVLQKMERAIRREEQAIRASSPSMHPDQIRKEAKSKVSKRWVQVTGAVTGALLRGFFGAMKIPPSGPLAITLALLTGLYEVVRGASMGYHAAEEAQTPQEGAWLAVRASVLDRKRQ